MKADRTRSSIDTKEKELSIYWINNS